MDPKIIVIYKAQSMIERDALLNELRENGIEALGEQRDVSRKISDGSVDLAFGGASVFMNMEGFAISINADDKAKAEKVISDFFKKVKLQDAQDISEPSTAPYLKKFYTCAIFSIFLPIVFHVVGLYYLYLGLKSKEKIQPFKFAVSVSFYLIAVLAAGFVISANF